jgi:hypothetical protein
LLPWFQCSYTCRDSGSNSVTQGDFGDPCVYLTASGGNPAGFDSGLQNGMLFSIKVTNDQLRKHIRPSVTVVVVGKSSTQQPSISFPNRGKSVAKEWSGKWPLSGCIPAFRCPFFPTNVSMFPSAINPPTIGDTYDAYLDAAKTLGPSQNTVMFTALLVPHPEPSSALILSRGDLQLIDSGPVLGGLGAEAQGNPSPIPSPSPSSSSSHLVPNSFFALLAAVFGITLA